jgi:hypothetical protein
MEADYKLLKNKLAFMREDAEQTLRGNYPDSNWQQIAEIHANQMIWLINTALSLLPDPKPKLKLVKPNKTPPSSLL